MFILQDIRTYSGTEEAKLHNFGSQCKADVRKRNFTSWGTMTERKNGSGTSRIWQSWQSVSAEEELHIFWQVKQSLKGEVELQIFGIQGRAEVRKRNFTSLELPAEMKCGSGPSHLWKTCWNKNGMKKCTAILFSLFRWFKKSSCQLLAK